MFVDFAGIDSAVTRHADRRASMDSLLLIDFPPNRVLFLGVALM